MPVSYKHLDEEAVSEAKVSVTGRLNNNGIEINGDVRFDHVRFGYDDSDEIIIKDFSANVKAGQKIAVVGPTGAGKTTIVKLLMRFHDLKGGTIFIDGHNIEDFTRHDIRNAFGMVLQDTWLYNGTIMDNIRYGRLDADVYKRQVYGMYSIIKISEICIKSVKG